MELAWVNDYEEAKLFFEEYDIPYEEVTEGKEKGKLFPNGLGVGPSWR